MSENTFCGGVHCAAGALLTAMAAWNLLKLATEAPGDAAGSRRHAFNASLYAGLAVFESYQTWRHWRQPH